jgi:hypothetical protein
LKWLEWFRGALGKPVTVNTYGYGGHLTQRGYRCNLCPIVMRKTLDNDMYLSAHTRFQAVDFNVNGMTDQEVRDFIEEHKKDMPCNIRVELSTTGWVHVDVASDNYQKITYFDG